MALERRQIEEYLEIMYRKKQKGEKITTTGIARELSVSPASVSEMLKKLERMGFVEVVPYKGAVLTDKGEDAGKAMLRKHRLLEDFLIKFGLGRRKAHKDACALEHALSKEAERAFEMAASAKTAKPLCSLHAGQKGRIAYIAGGREALIRVMELGLTEGTVVEVLQMSKYGCPIKLRARGCEIAIGRGIAEKIYVEVI